LSEQRHTDRKVADDVLRTVARIGDELGLTERQAAYGIALGHYSAAKIGGIWTASKTQLRREHRRRTSQQFEKKEGVRP
jgi:hypothetical protein